MRTKYERSQNTHHLGIEMHTLGLRKSGLKIHTLGIEIHILGLRTTSLGLEMYQKSRHWNETYDSNGNICSEGRSIQTGVIEI